MPDQVNQQTASGIEVTPVSYPNGASFDTTSGDSFPITINPTENIEEVLLSIVGTEVDLELSTIGGDTVTVPIDSKSAVDSYSATSIEIKNPSDSTQRIAGSWAGE